MKVPVPFDETAINIGSIRVLHTSRPDRNRWPNKLFQNKTISPAFQLNDSLYLSTVQDFQLDTSTHAFHPGIPLNILNILESSRTVAF